MPLVPLGSRAAALAIALAAALCAACSSADTANTVNPDARLTAQMKSILLTETLPDFELQPGLDKALGTEDAAQATSAAVAHMRQELGQSTFDGGYERVFKLDPDYITILVLDFQVPEDATAMVQFQVSELRSNGGNVVVADPVLAGAYAYDLQGTTRAGGKPVWCGGEWFSLDHFAFDVNYCGLDQYTSSNLARLLARNQYQKAGEALGLVSPPPTPTPQLIEPAPPNS